MKYFNLILFCVIGSIAADGVGDYMAKAYYTIDKNGNVEAVQPINANLLHRARRQVQPFGQPGFPFQAFPNFPTNQGQGSFVSTSQTLSSRFGEDEPVVSGQTTVIHSNDGKYQQTNTYIGPDGKVTTQKQTGRVKRQQTQSQQQDGQGGNQFQVQSQNPSGQQNQIQSQGQNQAPIAATPAAGQQYEQPNTLSQGNQQPQPQTHSQPQPQQPQQPQQPTADNRNQHEQSYQPQPGFQQPGFMFGAPFGLGGFGPGGFGFPQQGFGQPGFGFQNPFGFGPQPGFGPQAGFGPQPGFAGPGQTTLTGNRLDSRFSDDDGADGNYHGVYHSVSQVIGPDGKVITRHSSGKTH